MSPDEGGIKKKKELSTIIKYLLEKWFKYCYFDGDFETKR
jgi:hypothetical protein